MNQLLEEALKRFERKNYKLNIRKELSSGKEARVYLVELKDDLFALKVYKDYAVRSFQKNQEYLAGKHLHRPSERKAIQKRNKFGKRLMHRLWVKREFYMLKKLFDKGASIPEPIEMVNNAILMEYIGDEDNPAVLLKDVQLNSESAEKVYKKLVENIDIFYSCGIVHGDLSAFNVLYWKGDIFIIDFPQSIDIRNNPNTDRLLKRDKENVKKWYEKYKR